jgi:hypothetical protein
LGVGHDRITLIGGWTPPGMLKVRFYIRQGASMFLRREGDVLGRLSMMNEKEIAAVCAKI